MDELLKKSIFKSYLIGFPSGVLVLLSVFILPVIVTGEGLLNVILYINYGWATLSLFVMFVFALGIGGWLSYENTKRGKSTIWVSFIYSFIINFLIWTVFNLITLITNKGSLLVLLPGFLLFFVCTLLTTFTIGLIYSSSIRNYKTND